MFYEIIYNELDKFMKKLGLYYECGKCGKDSKKYVKWGKKYLCKECFIGFNLITNKSMNFIEKYHKNQIDDDGNNYIKAHLEPTSYILTLIAPYDFNLICAGLLHDILEDTECKYDDLKKEFGTDIANLVQEVTHEGKKDEYGYYFPHLKTKRGIMLKYADRLSNLSRIDSWDKKRQEQYLRKSKFWNDEQKRD